MTKSRKIRVSVSDLRENGEQINKQIEELAALNSRLEHLIGRIGDSWVGAASTAYLNMMRIYAEQAKSMISVLEQFKKYANDATEKFENTDNECAKLIRNSF